MAYNDPTFNIWTQESVVGSIQVPITLGTASVNGAGTATYINTATGTAGNGYFLLPKYIKPTQITNVRVYALGAASGGGVSGMTFWFATVNSTNTATVTNTNGTYTFTGVNTPFCGVVLTTGSPSATVVGTTYDGTMASSTVSATGVTTNPAWIGSNVMPVMIVTNTQTATASVLGSYAIDFESRTLFQT
jgi:hypothetical protein